MELEQDKPRDEPRYFYLRWRNKADNEFTTRYRYYGTGDQEGYTFAGWRSHCIEHGKKAGLTYLGVAPEPTQTLDDAQTNLARAQETLDLARLQQAKTLLDEAYVEATGALDKTRAVRDMTMIEDLDSVMTRLQAIRTATNTVRKYLESKGDKP